MVTIRSPEHVSGILIDKTVGVQLVTVTMTPFKVTVPVFPKLNPAMSIKLPLGWPSLLTATILGVLSTIYAKGGAAFPQPLVTIMSPEQEGGIVTIISVFDHETTGITVPFIKTEPVNC